MTATTGAPPRVSVVVPAYQPGDGIDRLVASLARQTMPQDEFELIIVDDGSPDDTWDRLQRIRDDRPNVRIQRIENSGWPSRPRNVGIDMARGEYVLFMDHDDEIFPDGLRASYEYAAAHQADVLSPKEVKTSDPTWGLGNFTSNIPNALPRRGIDALLPMMPHKLYRRDFLLEHGIRFPEGRRMLWEDVYFNVACYKYAKVVSILSDTPVYLWHSTDRNSSATYGPWEDEFWDRLARLFDFIAGTLDTDDLAAARKKQLMHQYKLRVISRLGDYLRSGRHPERVDHAVERALEIVDRHVPEEWDAGLPAVVRPRAWLLRRRRVDLLYRLQEFDAGFVGASATESVRWIDGVLQVKTVARWRGPEGRPLTFRVRGERLLRELPADLAVVPLEILDVTDEVRAASSVVTVRDRESHTTWNLPTKATVRVEPLDAPGETSELLEGDRVTVVVAATARLDPASAALGAPLTASVWDVRARNSVLGALHHAKLTTTTSTRPALVDGTAAVAYRANDDTLAVDLAQRLRTVVNDALPRVANALVSTTGSPLRRTTSFQVVLDGVHVHGRTRLEGTAELAPFSADPGSSAGNVTRGGRLRRALTPAVGAGRAVLSGGAEGAALEADVTSPPGRWRLVVTIGERRAVSPIDVEVPVRGPSRLLSRKA